MELQKAIEQLSEIHAQVSRTEFYRGFRAIPVALTGVAAFAAAFIQPYWVKEGEHLAFVLFWVFVAAVNVIFIAVLLVHDYSRRETFLERSKARNVFMQFGPALPAGALITAVMCRYPGEILAYLPGLWCLVFSLGVFAARPFFPRNTFWLGVYYLAAASVLLMLAPEGGSFHPWAMGLAFGTGQCLMAAVIYRDLERNHD